MGKLHQCGEVAAGDDVCELFGDSFVGIDESSAGFVVRDGPDSVDIDGVVRQIVGYSLELAFKLADISVSIIDRRVLSWGDFESSVDVGDPYGVVLVAGESEGCVVADGDSVGEFFL